MIPFDEFGFHQILSAPRLSPAPAQPDPLGPQLVAALTTAHARLRTSTAAQPAVAMLWHRSPATTGLRFLVGGTPFFPPVATPGAENTAVLYPPGATGRPVPADDLATTIGNLPVWLPCVGRNDMLQAAAPRRGRRGFDECLGQLAQPFAWLVLAEPQSESELDQELRTLTVEIPRLRNMPNQEDRQLALQHSQGRVRELARARSAGTWRVRILVGAEDDPSAKSAAALLCAASELHDLPYTLTPGSTSYSLPKATATGPIVVSNEFLAAVARPPARELPGLRLTVPPTFDVTPERDGPVRIGDVLDNTDLPVGRFGVTTATLNRHTFVAGATGGGKSQTVRHLLEQLSHIEVPWLVIEPAKAEYAAMAGRIGADQVVVIRPGHPDALPVGLNPLEPEPGFPLQTHLDLVRALFLAAFEAEEPFPQVLSLALTRCYTELGWDLALSESRLPGVVPRYPTLTDLQRTAMAVVTDIGYGQEVTDNIRGFIDVRIGSLRLGTPGRFFEGGHPLDIADLLARNVVLEIEDVGNNQDKAFFIGAVLIRMHQHLRTRRRTGPVQLRHVTVIEEAHRLLKRVAPGSPAAHAVELFADLLAELRAYGEGIVIAEQIPAKVLPDVVKNTALKIVHRLPAADDRAIVGATMNLDDAQSRHLVSLPPGRAAVFTDGMDHPIRVAVPLGEHREAVGSGPDAAVLSTRSVTCGALCRQAPCHLRDLSLGSRLAEDPRIVLWIELLTIAHLAGRPSPQPDAAWLAGLTANRRTLECAIAHRVQLAVDRRYSGLLSYYQPERLAKHLALSAVATVDDPTSRCAGTEVEWQAGWYRWADVFAELLEYDGSTPHPNTAAWAARGLQLSGTAADQLEQLRQRPDVWLPSATIITGTGPPWPYLEAADRLSYHPTAAERFLAATEYLGLDTDWPIHVLDISEEPA